jgi:hypothetical protein
MTGWLYIPPQDGTCPGSKVQGWNCRSRSQLVEVRILVLPWMGGDGEETGGRWPCLGWKTCLLIGSEGPGAHMAGAHG